MVKINFGVNFDYVLIVVMYGEFENVIEISSIGSVFYDIYG